MRLDGKTHAEAFQIIDNNLGFKDTSSEGTTRSVCIRGLRFFQKENFRTQEFVEAVSNGEIIQRAKKKRPKQIELIERELEPLYPELADLALA